jgi:hypothetical protein
VPTAGTASALAGVIAMVLLTLSVLLGVVLSRRPRPRRLYGPVRWLIHVAHRDVSLMAAVFLAIHIVTAVSARYGGVNPASVIVPFVARSERLWMGLSAVGTDLLVALILTTALRRRLGRRSWRRALGRVPVLAGGAPAQHRLEPGPAGRRAARTGAGLRDCRPCRARLAAGWLAAERYERGPWAEQQARRNIVW